MTSSPFQLTGVATFWVAVSRQESGRRRTSAAARAFNDVRVEVTRVVAAEFEGQSITLWTTTTVSERVHYTDVLYRPSAQ